MPLVCASCLGANPETHRFCGSCGSALFPGLARQSEPYRTESLAGQWSALKHATILFADIVSSTEHVQALDPEQAMTELAPAVQAMCSAVERFGGSVVRTLGDGVMALFGAPRALEGHASLACEAALAMQAHFRSSASALQIRVGLHSGQVAYAPESMAAPQGGGVHGHAIHLASRMVAMAEPGGICLSADCLALVRTLVNVRSMGRQSVKGVAEPLDLYALLEMKNSLENHRFHEATLTPFRGRGTELRLLEEAFKETGNGHGSVVSLCGGPGTGKSRLCHEFGRWCLARGVDVSTLRTQLYGHATPLQPVLLLLRSCFFNIVQADDAAAARARIRQGLARLQGASADDAALLDEFLGVAQVGGVACNLSPKARRARLLGLLRELVMREGQTVSVIVLEDLHWVDEASLEFLTVLIDAVAQTRTLLVLNYRPSFRPPWAGSPHVRVCVLAELDAGSTAEMVSDLLRSSPALQGQAALIVERSAGNPFFAEELIHSLQDKLALLQSAGQPHPDMPQLVRTLPATVQAVIAERIDRLATAQRTLLHICAVIGKEIPLSVLERVALYIVSQIESGLNSLCEAELLKILREVAGGRRFAFRHPLIQEVAYNMQFKARRAGLHASVAVAMEAHYSAQPGEFAALVAYHYAAADQPVQAAEHEAHAARWAGSTNSGQAIKHWRKVWALLDGQERTPQVNSLRAMAGGRIVYLGWREGLAAAEVELISREAIAIADARMAQLLVFVQGRMLQSAGGPADEYVECVKRAMAMSPETQTPGRQALLYVALSQAYTWAGLLKEALQASDAAEAGIGQIDAFDRDFIDFSIVQWRLGIRTKALIRLGRLDEAAQCLTQMEYADGGLNDPIIAQLAHIQRVEIAACLGDRSAAIEHSEKMTRSAQQHPSPYSQIYALWCQGLAAGTVGETGAAKQHYTYALELIAQTRIAVDFESEIQARYCELQYHCGNLSEAITVAGQAADTSNRRNNRATEGRALLVLAAAIGQQTGTDAQARARGLFNQADALMTQTGASLFEQPLLRERERLLKQWASINAGSPEVCTLACRSL